MKSQQKSGRSQMERRRRRREKFVEIFVCRWSRGSSRECVKSKGGTYRRRGRFEVPRKRRAGAPLRHWPVRRGLAPVKREDLLWLLVVPSLSVLHHLDGGCLVPFRPQFHASLSLSLSLWSFTITKRKTSRPINCRHASNKGSFVPLLVVLHHFFPPFFPDVQEPLRSKDQSTPAYFSPLRYWIEKFRFSSFSHSEEMAAAVVYYTTRTTPSVCVCLRSMAGHAQQSDSDVMETGREREK